MAQRVQVVLEDDIDGSKADETVRFSMDGAEYEIDLSSENAQKLREALTPWVEAGRRTGGRRKRATSSATPLTETAEPARVQAKSEPGRRQTTTKCRCVDVCPTRSAKPTLKRRANSTQMHQDAKSPPGRRPTARCR